MRSFIIASLLLIASLAEAQNLSVFNLDATNFPTLKASFYAFDANGVQQSPSPGEITITENGIPRTVTSVTCPPKKDPPPVTLGIMVDTYSGIDLAKEGAQKLINLISIPPSEAGITMMDHGAFIVQDLTQKHARLDTAINKLQPAPGVDLQTMFYAPNAGGVPFVSGRPNKKALVLFTDLHCPLYNLDKAKLLLDCAKEKISVYVVEINTNDEMGFFHPIVDATGGKLFEEVKTSSDITNIVFRIYNSLLDSALCQITWQSDIPCTGDQRNVEFTWDSSKSNLSYVPLPNTVAHLDIAPNALYLKSKPIGQKFDTTVTITAMNNSFTVTNITTTNPIYDINPKTFTLASGASTTLTVSFTPVDSTYSWTRFGFDNNLCAQTYYASGGYPGYLPNFRTLKLDSPNGGEVFQVGYDTVITWSGIPLNESVILEYSINSGNNWIAISRNAIGGDYLWHVPNTPSNNCLVRASQRSQNYSGGWSEGFGSQSSDGGLSTSTDKFGNIFETGYFTGTVDFGGIPLTSKGGKDIFVAKYFPDGGLAWVKDAGGAGEDVGYGIVSDDLGNVYVTGAYELSAFFDTIVAQDFNTVPYADLNIFVVKYSPTGNILWLRIAGSYQGSSEGRAIAIDSEGNIFVAGDCFDGAYFCCGSGRANNFCGCNNTFVAKYLSDGTQVWVTTDTHQTNNSTIGTGIAIDGKGEIYVVGKEMNYSPYKGGPPFVEKLDSNGQITWYSPVLGTVSNIDDSIGNYGICVDLLGNAFVTGHYKGSITFGKFNFGGSNNAQIFLAKYQMNGNIEWVDTFGNQTHNCAGHAITVDGNGNVYLALSFTDALNLAGITFNSSGEDDILLAAFSPKGNFEWARQAGGIKSDIPKSVTMDEFGNLIVSGSFQNSASVGNDTLQSHGNSDIFIWKLGSNNLQSDTSDAVFSIIAPTFSFAANSIDMGQVETGKEKDSLVKATICNSGNMPLHVLGMDVTGGAAAEFMIMSGAGDFTLAPGECRDVMFTFMPMMTGKMSATVTLRTANGNYPDTIKVFGEGIAPELQVMSSVIDFGEVSIGSFKDTTIAIAIQNIGSLPVNFSGVSQLGPDVKQFSLQSGGAPFTLLPKAPQSVTLRFTPHYIGRTSGRVAFAYNGPSTPAILNVFGQGLGGAVAIMDDSGFAGDHKNIPMILEKVPVSSVQSEATNFSARIAYDRTVLYPSSGVIQKGNRFDTVAIKGSLSSTDTIGFIRFTALLGENTTSPMNLVDFAWLDGAGQPADYDVETSSGTFYMLGICPAGGNRLYNPDGQVGMSISPNPANGIIHIDLQTTELGRTQLGIMNLLGQKVANISDGELKPGAHSFDFNVGSLSAGSYFLLLQTPTVRRLERIDVEK